MTEKQIKLIITVPEDVVCKGFEQPLTEEERQTLIRAIGNGTLYKENTGVWELSGYSEVGKDWYKCSCCGRTIHTVEANLKEYPYCHCGAKMNYKR